eukprot:gb/GECG01008744.1/.p1 GENE.gb/GECG01008744.1/~~gb/GECG01008744.1/.p1  ORF type:complete len:393 (+),score=41.33 gb/GECG01008744.1/:1-1179(+)
MRKGQKKSDVRRESVLQAPDTNHQSYQSILKWFQRLSRGNEPRFLGLSSAVEAYQNKKKGQHLLRAWQVLRHSYVSSGEQDTAQFAVEDAADSTVESKSKNRIKLSESQKFIRDWTVTLDECNNKLNKQPRDENTSTPRAMALVRWLSKEREALASIVDAVVKQMTVVLLYIDEGSVSGGISFNQMSVLLSSIQASDVPPSWLSLDALANCQPSIRMMSLHKWLQLLVSRVESLSSLTVSDLTEGGKPLWLGGLSFPQSFITSFIQYAADYLQCSVGAVILRGSGTPAERGDSVPLTLSSLGLEYGMLVENSNVSQAIAISQRHVNRLDSLCLSFDKLNDSSTDTEIEIPLYTDDSRQRRVTSIYFRTAHSSMTPKDFNLRHVALIGHEMLI